MNSKTVSRQSVAHSSRRQSAGMAQAASQTDMGNPQESPDARVHLTDPVVRVPEVEDQKDESHDVSRGETSRKKSIIDLQLQLHNQSGYQNRFQQEQERIAQQMASNMRQGMNNREQGGITSDRSKKGFISHFRSKKSPKGYYRLPDQFNTQKHSQRQHNGLLTTKFEDIRQGKYQKRKYKQRKTSNMFKTFHTPKAYHSFQVDPRRDKSTGARPAEPRKNRNRTLDPNRVTFHKHNPEDPSLLTSHLPDGQQYFPPHIISQVTSHGNTKQPSPTQEVTPSVLPELRTFDAHNMNRDRKEQPPKLGLGDMTPPDESDDILPLPSKKAQLKQKLMQMPINGQEVRVSDPNQPMVGMTNKGMPKRSHRVHFPQMNYRSQLNKTISELSTPQSSSINSKAGITQGKILNQTFKNPLQTLQNFNKTLPLLDHSTIPESKPHIHIKTKPQHLPKLGQNSTTFRIKDQPQTTLGHYKITEIEESSVSTTLHNTQRYEHMGGSNGSHSVDSKQLSSDDGQNIQVLYHDMRHVDEPFIKDLSKDTLELNAQHLYGKKISPEKPYQTERVYKGQFAQSRTKIQIQNQIRLIEESSKDSIGSKMSGSVKKPGQFVLSTNQGAPPLLLQNESYSELQKQKVRKINLKIQSPSPDKLQHQKSLKSTPAGSKQQLTMGSQALFEYYEEADLGSDLNDTPDQMRAQYEEAMAHKAQLEQMNNSKQAAIINPSASIIEDMVPKKKGKPMNAHQSSITKINQLQKKASTISAQRSMHKRSNTQSRTMYQTHGIKSPLESEMHIKKMTPALNPLSYKVSPGMSPSRKILTKKSTKQSLSPDDENVRHMHVQCDSYESGRNSPNIGYSTLGFTSMNTQLMGSGVQDLTPRLKDILEYDGKEGLRIKKGYRPKKYL